MMKAAAFSLVAAIVSFGSMPSLARADAASDKFAADQAASNEKALISGGAWHYKSFRCVDTVVTLSSTRLQGVGDGGNVVVLASNLGFEGVKPGTDYAHAGVTKYESDPVMKAERKGDKVQACLLSISPPINGCNPDTDPRGRTFRIYDYRQHRAYDGMNSEHDCGGA